MKRLAQIVPLLLLALLCAMPAFANEEPLDKLIARAQNDNDPKLYARVVDRYAELAHQDYSRGDSTKALDDVNVALKFAGKAREYSGTHTNKIKDAEILLRKAQRTLEQLARSADVDDRPPLEKAAVDISRLRDEMLNLMFGK